MNLGEGPGRGAQLGGFANGIRGDLRGLQLSGAINLVDGEVRGAADRWRVSTAPAPPGAFSSPGGINIAEHVDGLQLAPVNVAGEMRGFQLGVVNVAGAARASG